jgi:hypothetical protein
MSPLRLNGSTSGFSQLDAPAIAGDQTFTLPGTGGTIDRLNRAGNILQVVNGQTSTIVTNATSTFADTTLTATITPTSASSKIFILVSQSGVAKLTNNTSVSLRLLRNSTSILQFVDSAGSTNSTAYNEVGGASACYLDSPATTSAVTYKTQFASAANTATVVVQNYFASPLCNSTITLLEVAA